MFLYTASVTEGRCFGFRKMAQRTRVMGLLGIKKIDDMLSHFNAVYESGERTDRIAVEYTALV